MKKPIFTIKNLFFSYKGIEILKINKFDLHRGAMYLLSGSMGAGKSTLIQILSKNKNIEEEIIFYEGKDLTKIKSSTYKKDLVYLGQINNRPWLSSSVEDYMLKKIKGNSNNDYKEASKRICNLMKINSSILSNDISSLSEGEYRWIQLAISIALDSKVLIVDYLEKYLDLNKRIILNRILKRKTSHDGVTIIASTYNPDFFKMSASVLIKMDKGRIAQVRSLAHKSK